MVSKAGFYIIQEALFEAGNPVPSYAEWPEFHLEDDPPETCEVWLNGGDHLRYDVAGGPFMTYQQAIEWMNRESDDER